MTGTYVVYRRPADAGPDVGIDYGIRLLRWSPTLLNAAPPQLVHERNGFRKNWLYHLPAMLLQPGKAYVVYMLLKGDEPVCQCILTPSSKRFPFMAARDWQFGLVHTSTAHRRQGLAAIMVKQILRQRGEGGSYWWLTETENTPSRRLAESISFLHFGKAIRKRGASGVPHFEILQNA